MLDMFLEAACQANAKELEKRALVENLKKLPYSDLLQLSEGKTVLAGLCHSGDMEWLDKFKGTPLFEQALALEKSSLEQEVASEQKRRQDRSENEAQDQIRLQKRLLELQLVQIEQQEAGAAAAQAASLPGTPPPVAPVEGVLAEAPKMASAWTGWMEGSCSKVAEASIFDGWGRELARADAEKIAFDPIGAASTLGRGLGKGINWAAKSPLRTAAVGAAGGAALGAVTAGEGNRTSGALRGGLMGGAVGGAAGFGAQAAQKGVRNWANKNLPGVARVPKGAANPTQLGVSKVNSSLEAFKQQHPDIMQAMKSGPLGAHMDENALYQNFMMNHEGGSVRDTAGRLGIIGGNKSVGPSRTITTAPNPSALSSYPSGPTAPTRVSPAPAMNMGG